MTASYLRAGNRFPDPTEHDHARHGGSVSRDVGFETDDVARIQGVHVGDRSVFGHDDRLCVTGQIGAALTLDTQPPALTIDFDDHEPRLLQPFGKAVGHCAPCDGSADDAAGSSIFRYVASSASRSARAPPTSAASRRSSTSCLMAGGMTGPSATGL